MVWWSKINFPMYSEEVGHLIMRPHYKPKPSLPPPSRCAYIIQRDSGKRCPNVPAGGTRFCFACMYNPMDYGIAPEPAGPELELRFIGVDNWSGFRNILTDIILEAEGVPFLAHKIILTRASPYFGGLLQTGLMESGRDKITLQGVEAKTLGLYLDLIYGQQVIVQHWREAFDLFDYFDRTLLSWDKEWVATSFQVPPEDYPEFIQRLDQLHGGLTAELIEQTRKYVTPEMDLSMFEPEFVKVIRPPVELPYLSFGTKFRQD